MSELAKLGAIIDELYSRRRSHKKLTQRLVFIVGNGIDRVCNILNDEDLRRKAGRRYLAPSAFEVFKWRHFEYARYYTSTSLPSFAHCCIHRLVEDGICRDIITTNYDLFFDTIWQKFADSKICQNPVLKPGEYHWDGFYTNKSLARSKVRYWKIHGSLSHVCFQSSDENGSHHLYRLPRFAISGNDDSLARSYGLRTQAVFLGLEAMRFPRTRFASPAELKASFSPFIDWTYRNDRTRFKREISAVQKVLKDYHSIAAIVLIGFSGYYNDSNPNDPWNEELVPEIRRLMAGGYSQIFMAVHNAQHARIHKTPYGLMRELVKEKRCWRYEVAGDFMRDLVTRYSYRFPCNYADYEHERWTRLYMPKFEASYATPV